MKALAMFCTLAALAGCCAMGPPLPNENPGPAPECASPDAGGALTCPGFNVPCAEPSDCCVLLGGADCLDVAKHFRCEWCCDPAGAAEPIRELSCVPVD